MRTALYLAVAATWLVSGAALSQSEPAGAQAEGVADSVADSGAAQPQADLSRSERRESARAERAAAEQAELAASAAQPGTAQTGEAAAEDDDGVICRRENVLGTHRRIRVCTTREQREAMRQASREVITDISRNRGRLDPVEP